MRQTKLILVEGIPGTGKSTLAHALLRQLRAQGHAARWWYEEEVGHPVYLFQDHAGLVRVIEDLEVGRFRRLIDDALAQWRNFAARVAADEVVILDGTLFGYLTWSLFPYLAPEEEIRDYVAAVAAILSDLNPSLIYLRQDDLAAAWRWLAERRGDTWLHNAIARNARTPYGEHHGLTGFSGLIAFWQSFQDLADAAFARLPCATLRLSAAVTDRDHYLPAALDFLGLAHLPEPRSAPEQFAQLAGRYRARDAAGAELTIATSDAGLRIDGLSQFWPQNRLVPLPDGTFAVDSFPHTVAFGPGGTLTIRGPLLLSGAIAEEWDKQVADA